MSNKEPGYVYILTNPNFRVISRTDPVIILSFCIYIIIVVAVFVKDEFKDEDDPVGDHCIKNCE